MTDEKVTPIGIQDIKKRILGRNVEAPDDLPIAQLQAWMSGYGEALESCIEVLDAYLEESR